MKCKVCNRPIDFTNTDAPFCSFNCELTYKASKDELKKHRINQKPIKRDQINVKRTLHRRKT